MTSSRKSAHPVLLRRVITAEAIKLATLPTYTVSFISAFVILPAFGLTAAFVRVLRAQDDPTQWVPFTPSELFVTVQGVQILLALIAVVFVTSEFEQGTVQPTFLAVPKRLPVLVAKAALIGTLTFVIGAVGALLALLGAPLILIGGGFDFNVAPGFATQLIFGTGLYLTALSLFALALAAIIRSTVGSLLTVLAVYTLAPLALAAVPIQWVQEATLWLPTVAGLFILRPEGANPTITPWGGVGVTVVWALIALISAAITIRTTDS